MESPGTAPGSDPFITSAFMSIVPKDMTYIGDGLEGCKYRIYQEKMTVMNALSGLIEVCRDQQCCQYRLDSSK